jgi:hypothetical protein
MEAVFSSEMSEDLYWTTGRYIPEDSKYSSGLNISMLSESPIIITWHSIRLQMEEAVVMKS